MAFVIPFLQIIGKIIIGRIYSKISTLVNEHPCVLEDAILEWLTWNRYRFK
jgi:hypothetical protein